MTATPDPVTPEPNESVKPPKTPRPENPDDILSYLKANARETIAYILLILGILLIYFEPFYGGTLVGLIAGIYFGDEILAFVQNWKEFIDREGIPRSLVVGGVIFAFFISAPAIFIGAVVALLIKQVFLGGMAPPGGPKTPDVQ